MAAATPCSLSHFTTSLPLPNRPPPGSFYSPLVLCVIRTPPSRFPFHFHRPLPFFTFFPQTPLSSRCTSSLEPFSCDPPIPSSSQIPQASFLCEASRRNFLPAPAFFPPRERSLLLSNKLSFEVLVVFLFSIFLKFFPRLPAVAILRSFS